jgi:rhodanese-related sulfurtransferase
MKIRLAVLFFSSLLVSVCLSYALGRTHYSPQHWFIKEYSLHSGVDSNALLIDVRSAEDFARSHIPGALSLDPQNWDATLPAFLEHWSPETLVIIYCGGQACGLSKEVALRLLTDLPDAKISVLKGGFPAWQAHQAQLKPAS